jgi:hypothetical protein
MTSPRLATPRYLGTGTVGKTTLTAEWKRYEFGPKLVRENVRPAGLAFVPAGGLVVDDVAAMNMQTR